MEGYFGALLYYEAGGLLISIVKSRINPMPSN